MCRVKNKGKDTCVEKKDSSDCVHCNALTPEQKVQLATPSYKIKKEKRDAQKLESDNVVKDSESLVDPSLVSVIGPVDGSSPPKSPSLPPEKKLKKEKPKKSTASSADGKITELDLKWSERFNRLEALLLSKSFPPSFSSDIKVPPSHSPPSNVGKDVEPFFQPSSSGLHIERTSPDGPVEKQLSAGKLVTQDSPKRTGPDNKEAEKLQSTGKLVTDSSTRGNGSSRRTGPDSKAASKHLSAGKPSHTASRHTGSDNPLTGLQSTGKSSTDRPLQSLNRPQPSSLSGSVSPTLQKSAKQDSVSSDYSASDSEYSDPARVELFVEEDELSDNPDMEVEQTVSEEQMYRETMRGIRAYMGWSHVPDVDSSNPSDDNPFAGPKTPAPSKVSVQMPTEEWLCKKLSKLNVSLVEGYPSRISDAGGLSMDQFLRPAKSQAKWYGICPTQKSDSQDISSWNTSASKLNSSYTRIARRTGMTSTPPASRRISQDTLRRWEQTAREATVICNQTASFNRCMFRVQQDMTSQLKSVQLESKGKSSAKSSEALDELQHLIEFNSSITQSAAKAMEHLTDFVFVTMGNLTLIRRDAYLSHLKNGIKHDTLAALRSSPLQLSTLFPDPVLKKAEEEIAYYDSKNQSQSTGKGKGQFHPYERPEKKGEGRSEVGPDRQAWKNIGRKQQ